MRFKLLVLPILTVSLLLAALPAVSQTVAPYQTQRSIPIVFGIGPSAYNPDWGHGIMYGGSVWVDWYPKNLPPFLNGFGVEAEARDISLNKHPNPGQSDPQRSGQENTKEDTAGGGVIYAWRYFHSVHPYVKAIFSQGSVDFIGTPTYNHDTRLVMAGGGGLEYRIYRPIWARVDYEYQVWGKLLGNNVLTPEGLTVGVSYDLSHPLP
jgi:Outer membrane protein beta-barrel domain